MPVEILSRFYHWMWADLGLEEPHPARALLYVGAALLLCGVLWALLIAVLL